MKKQLLNPETDWARLFGTETDLMEEMLMDPLTVPRSGEAVFCWESPPVASPEEAVSMARQAAAEMAPEPGRDILAVFLHITAEPEWDLDAVEKVANSIQESFDTENKGIDVAFWYTHGDERTHFVLITAERNREEREHRP